MLDKKKSNFSRLRASFSYSLDCPKKNKRREKIGREGEKGERLTINYVKRQLEQNNKMSSNLPVGQGGITHS